MIEKKDNYVSMDVEFESNEEKEAFLEKINKLLKETNGKEPDPERLLNMRRSISDELEQKNVECFFKGLGLELMSILDPEDLKLRVYAISEQDYDHIFDVLSVDVTEGSVTQRKSYIDEISELLFHSNEVSDLDSHLNGYTYRAPWGFVHESGVEVHSSKMVVTKIDLGLTVNGLTEEGRYSLNTELFDNMIGVFDKSKKVEFDSGYFFDNEEGYKDKDNYPELVYNIEKRDMKDKTGVKRNFSSLIVRIDKGFSTISFIHFDDVDFSEEIKMMENFFKSEFKKNLLKYKFI